MTRLDACLATTTRETIRQEIPVFGTRASLIFSLYSMCSIFGLAIGNIMRNRSSISSIGSLDRGMVRKDDLYRCFVCAIALQVDKAADSRRKESETGSRRHPY